MNTRKLMPVVFTGHGYPMNAITENRARSGWKEAGLRIGKPEAIVAFTCHWETSGTCVRTAARNPQLFDIEGLPDEIYSVHYEPPASLKHVEKVLELLGGEAFEDNSWGIDHALWTTLSNMYPEGDVPVVIASVDAEASPEDMLLTGRKLAPLRRENVLIFTTGNIAHNVDKVDHGMPGGYSWAKTFDRAVKDLVLSKDLKALAEYKKIRNYELNMPTPEHYYPLLIAAGASFPEDEISVFNEYTELGSLSMTSYIFGA